MGRGGKREIQSTDSLKFLGFYFDTRPSPVAHVEQIKRKFRSRAWIIRKLKKPCVQSEDLVSLYGVLIRPVLNYVSSAYHTMLTADQTKYTEDIFWIEAEIQESIRRGCDCITALAKM